MDMLLGLIVLVVGTGLAILINRLYHSMFDVAYFGCGAVVTEWVVCFIIGTTITEFLVKSFSGVLIFGFKILKWILIGAVILAVIGLITGKLSGNEEDNNKEISDNSESSNGEE